MQNQRTPKRETKFLAATLRSVGMHNARLEVDKCWRLKGIESEGKINLDDDTQNQNDERNYWAKKKAKASRKRVKATDDNDDPLAFTRKTLVDALGIRGSIAAEKKMDDKKCFSNEKIKSKRRRQSVSSESNDLTYTEMKRETYNNRDGQDNRKMSSSYEYVKQKKKEESTDKKKGVLDKNRNKSGDSDKNERISFSSSKSLNHETFKVANDSCMKSRERNSGKKIGRSSRSNYSSPSAHSESSYSQERRNRRSSRESHRRKVHKEHRKKKNKKRLRSESRERKNHTKKKKRSHNESSDDKHTSTSSREAYKKHKTSRHHSRSHRKHKREE